MRWSEKASLVILAVALPFAAIGWVISRPHEAIRIETDAVVIGAKPDRSRRGFHQSCRLQLAYSYQELIDGLDAGEAQERQDHVESYISLNYFDSAEEKYRKLSRDVFPKDDHPYVAINGVRASGRCSDYPRIGGSVRITYNGSGMSPRLVATD